MLPNAPKTCAKVGPTLDNFWSFKGYGRGVVMGHPAFSFLCEYLFFN